MRDFTMSVMLHNFKQKIEKHYKKVVPVFLAVLFVVLSPVQAYAFDSQPSSVLENSWIIHNTDYSFGLNLQYYDDTGAWVSKSTSDKFTEEQISSGKTMYSFHFDEATDKLTTLELNNYSSRIDFEYIPTVYDYYVLLQFFYPGSDWPIGSSVPNPNALKAMYYWYNSSNMVDFSDYKCSLNDTSGFTVTGKIPEPSDSGSGYFLTGFHIDFEKNSNGVFNGVPTDINFEGLIVAVPKSGGYDDSAVIAAIEEQTTALGGKLESIQSSINNNFNDFMSAGSGHSGTVDGITSGNSQLTDYINQYTQVEQSMTDSFISNQDAVSGDFSSWQWGSLSTAVDWTSDYLNTMYDNSGDFRTMFMYPILAGIALIFIGRSGLSAYSRSKKGKGD